MENTRNENAVRLLYIDINSYIVALKSCIAFRALLPDLPDQTRIVVLCRLRHLTHGTRFLPDQ